jgi:dTDP-L-rhamnose 4-epimerase
MRVLVTGGAGFIGSHVVDVLVDRGWDVRVLDALLPVTHAAPPDHLNPAAEYLWGNLLDEGCLRKAIAGVDAVSHQAAMVGLGVRFDDVVDYVRHNDLGTATLLRALASTGFGGRLVVAGSMVVYGEGRYRCKLHGIVRPGPRDPGRLSAGLFDPPCPGCGRDLVPEPVPEDAQSDPRNVYAATKLHQEHLCAAFGRERSVPVTTLRYHNVYGPGMPRDTPYAGVASIFHSALEAGRSPQVFEDGGQLRDFVHVRDVARANGVALEREFACVGPFNIASGRPQRVGGLANALADAFGTEAPRPEVTGDFRLGDVRHVFASPRRAEEILDFKSIEEFEPGIRELVAASSPA